MSKRQLVNPRAYARTHARLAAEVRAADDRLRAWSRRAADVALGAVLVGLGWLVIPYIGG